MKRDWNMIALAIGYAATAAIPLSLIFAAPVMREEASEPQKDWVCHVDDELLDGELVPVSKCHEETVEGADGPEGEHERPSAAGTVAT